MDIYERRYEDLKRLIVHANLNDIQFHELSAKLYDDPPDPSGETSDAQVDLVFQTRVGAEDFGIRVAASVAADVGTAQAIVAADYDVTPEYLPDEELLRLFATEVAMMTIFPYIREGIQTATTRVFGAPLTLPIMHRGQITAESIAQE